VRGKGLMLGVEFNNGKAAEIKGKCFEKGYLVGSVGNSILRLLPPLIVTRTDIDDMITTLDGIFSEIILAENK
jgi:acetylornithine aminotransferase/acetylornithine/N-succinyldiaminopimelate aminotransferase